MERCVMWLCKNYSSGHENRCCCLCDINDCSTYKTNRGTIIALNRAVDKIYNFEGHKRTVEAIRNELMGGSDENKTR